MSNTISRRIYILESDYIRLRKQVRRNSRKRDSEILTDVLNQVDILKNINSKYTEVTGTMLELFHWIDAQGLELPDFLLRSKSVKDIIMMYEFEKDSDVKFDKNER